MLKLLFPLILLNIYFIAHGQENAKAALDGRITGKVIDSASKSPLAFATVSLYQQGTYTIVGGTTTGNNGQFKLTGIKSGVFTMVIEFVGYHSVSINNIYITKTSPSVELNNIVLSSSTKNLKDITITGKKPTIENKIDKIVFNVEKDITSQGGVATDVLKKVPQVTVGIDGSVELLGSSNIRFLINGKPSSVFGSNITDVLQSIPASQIKSIEVMTNPGAKYDAQGLGGIINIILKQNTAKGINGNLSLTAGTRMENGSLNFNARKGNLGLNAFLSGNVRLPASTPLHAVRISQDTLEKTEVFLQQDGTSTFSRHGIQSGMGFDWTFMKKNSIFGSFNYFHFGNASNGYTNQYQVTSDPAVPGNIISEYANINRFTNTFHNETVDFSLNYKRTFAKKDQELDILLTSSLANRFNGSSSNQFLQPQDSLYYGTNGNNPGKENETRAQLDYTHPLNEKVLAGIGAIFTSNDINSKSNIYLLDPYSGEYIFNTVISNHLNYHQKVYALYSEISFPVAKLFDAKIGGHYERTEIASYYSNAQQQNITSGYNTFVPAIYFLKKLSDKQTLKLSYSKRIERPDYGELNPFINTSDPKNITAGNPHLLPEIGNRFELSFNQNLGNAGSIMATFFHRINHNDIQPFIVYYPTLQVGDTIFRNVYVTTPQNIGTEKNTGLNLFGEINAGSKLTFRSNLIFFYRYTINTQDQGYNSHSFNYRFNLNGTYHFKNDFTAEFFGSFNSARHEAQGRYPSFTNYSIAVRKQFWSRNGSLALSLVNPFNEYVKQTTELFGPNFAYTGTKKIPFRAISLNFTWKFGKLEFKKEKEDGNEPDAQAPVSGR